MKGIYKITCGTTGVSYIGSTSVSFKKRWRKHKQRLRHNYHENSYLQHAWNKYGESDFKFEVIEELMYASDEKIKEQEAYWLSQFFLKGRDYCFNLSDHTDGGNTIKSKEAKQKHSKALKDSYTSELREVRRKQAIGNNTIEQAREKVNTPEWKEAHLKGVRKLAKDPNWLQQMKDINKHRQVKVGTDKGEIFESVTEAAKQTGAMRANIRTCIKGKIKTSKGRKWFYVE